VTIAVMEELWAVQVVVPCAEADTAFVLEAVLDEEVADVEGRSCLEVVALTCLEVEYLMVVLVD